MLVYEDDDIDVLIQQFGTKYGLSEGKMGKLKTVLVNQLRTGVITAIREDQEEESYMS